MTELSDMMKRDLSFGEWEKLSWVLQNGWIQDYKWFQSELAGYDVGTPFAVDYILKERLEQFSPRAKAEIFRKWLITGYLLGTDFHDPLRRAPSSDEHGANQLEGELRRYWAMKENISDPAKVLLTRDIVDEFCAEYGLHNVVTDEFAERLRL